MLLTLAAAFVLLEAPLPVPSLPPPLPVQTAAAPKRADAPCATCTCCAACPCGAITVQRVVRDFLNDDTLPAPVVAPEPKRAPVQHQAEIPAKTWVKLVNEPGVEAYGSLGADGYVYGIESRRYVSPPAAVPASAPRLYYGYGSACANGSCARP